MMVIVICLLANHELGWAKKVSVTFHKRDEVQARQVLVVSMSYDAHGIL